MSITKLDNMHHPQDLLGILSEHADDIDAEITEDATHEGRTYTLYSYEHGDGFEVRAAFLTENEEVIASLVLIYDPDESDMNPSFETEEGEQLMREAYLAAPAVFSHLLMDEESPFLWNFTDYPATMRTVFTTLVLWNTGDQWETHVSSEHVDTTENLISYAMQLVSDGTEE